MLINNIREFVQECTECYYYYVELHMSYDKVAKEVLLSPGPLKILTEILMICMSQRGENGKMAKRRKRDLQQLRDANERLMDWQGMENVPNDVKMYRDMLADFYKSIGKKVAHPELFSTRVNLTRKQQEVLNDISFQVLNKWTTDFSQYENFLVDEERSDVRDRYDIKTLDDAINFLDEMETSRNEAWLADLLSSDQIKELYDEG